MSTEENKAIVGRWFTEFWGKEFNPAVIGELAAPGIFSGGRARSGGSDPRVCAAQRLIGMTLPCATTVVQVCYRRV
ncbi:MAG: hypothetical protein ACRDOI_10180, partial [Trebonia sp.]